MLDQAQQNQNEQVRPELSTYIKNMEQYDAIILGYPNWWGSMPLPIASLVKAWQPLQNRFRMLSWRKDWPFIIPGVPA